MMVAAHIAGEQRDRRTLSAILTAAARRSTDGKLAIGAAIGVLLVTAAVVLRPPGWIAIGACGACGAAYGLWAIADRELLDWRGRVDPPRAGVILLRALRSLAALTGSLAAGLLLFLLLAQALGTWRT